MKRHSEKNLDQYCSGLTEEITQLYRKSHPNNATT